MKCILTNITRDNGNSYVYAELRTLETDELLISSTIDDIFDKMFENNLEVTNIVRAIDQLLNIGFVSITCNYTIAPAPLIKSSHYYHEGQITSTENDFFNVIIPVYNSKTNTFTTERVSVSSQQIIRYSI